MIGAVADRIDQIAANPAGAIQQLSNVLAAAIGKTVPTVSVTPFAAGPTHSRTS